MLVNILIVTAIYVAISIYEIPPLVDRKYKPELFVVLAFLLPAYVLSLLYAIDVKIPRILPAITSLLQPLLNWLG